MADALLKGYTQQQSVAVSGDGQWNGIRATRDGKLITADWKLDLILRGYGFNVTVGGIAAGGDVSLITGGGDGTIIDTDQPEMLIQTPVSHFHIPLGFKCTIQADAGGADADEHNIILFADITPAAIIASATATAETPSPLLDGGALSRSTCWSAVTADLTDPTCDILLDFATSQAAQVTAASTVVHVLKMDYDPSFPMFFKGPVAVVACWGGTNACTGAASYCWAEVPVSQVE